MPPTARWALRVGLLCAAALIFLIVTWNAFFHYVPPGKMLVIVAKNGSDLPPGQVLAEQGQRGIQRDVLGEGWHFVMPVVNATELKDNTVVPAGQIGIVTALGGVKPRNGRVLAEEDDEQGIRRKVLPPGAYRLNPYGYTVEPVGVTEIKPGYVGVRRRLLGKEGKGRFAEMIGEEKGILREVLQPGLYYVNTKEFEVLPEEIGIEQTTYKYDPDSRKSSAIVFPVKDGNNISIDVTIEWEVLPQNMPALVAEFGGQSNNRSGTWQNIERNVIDQQVRKISRDRGFNYGAQDFLDGDKREAFQNDFMHELERICKEKNVVIRSAFIRNIVIPEDFLRQKRERQIAAETKITNEAKEKTAQSDAEVEREKRLIDQRVQKVQAETARMVAGIDRDVQNFESLTDAEIDKLKSQYASQIAELEAQQKRVTGEAEAQVKQLKETAKSSLYKMKLDVFGNDGSAYLRYSLAEQLNPKIVLRLFQSGPGTFWTNMDGKGVNLLLQTPGANGRPAEAASPAGK
jgi:hypothetical protein